MNEQPLIWTSKGNLPIADLAYSTAWEESPDATVFIEEYRQGDEVVKRSVHALSKHGMTCEGAAGGVA